MVKNIILFALFILLTSCSEESKSERYFVNCVKDAMKVKKISEGTAVDYCEIRKGYAPEEFNYYKGRVYSKER